MLRAIFVASGNLFFRVRNAIFPVIFVALVVLVRPALFLDDPALDPYATAIGAVVALLGGAVRCATIGLVYIVRGGRGGKVYADGLVREGIYAHSRNPMYVGNMMIAAGLSVMYGALLVWATLIPFFAFVYMSIVLAEENYLAKRFGDEFEDYRRTVNRFLPGIRGLRKTLSEHRFDWKRVVFKDYGTITALLATVYVLAAVKYELLVGPGAVTDHPAIAAIPLGVILVGYVTARIAKKGRII